MPPPTTVNEFAMEAPDTSNHQDSPPQATDDVQRPYYVTRGSVEGEIRIVSRMPNLFDYLSAGNIADILEEYEELNQSPASSEYCDDFDEFNPDPPVASQLEESATRVDSAFSVSECERNTYYNGISGEGEDPKLLYRTGSEKYPWAEPSDGLPCQSRKSVHEVADTPLNEVWDTVGPRVSELVREKVQTDHSLSIVRFATHVEDGESIDGPVVIWISVPPGSTSPNTAHEVSQRILQLLENNGVKDVEVEWCEAAVTSRSLDVI